VSDVSQPGLPETGPAVPAPGSRRLKYALVASLALNLLVAGAVAGMAFGFFKHRPSFGVVRSEDFGLMGLTRHIPEERRKEVRKQLREDRDRLRPLVDDIRASRRDAADKLAAEPFDKAALETAIKATSSKESALRETAIAAFLGHVEKLTPSERQLLADWWRKRSEPLRPRKSKKDKEDEASPPPN
jgi:uncharacterized membrane protein